MSTILDSIVKEFTIREQRGVDKYKTTMDRKDLSKLEWLQHLKEELMDAVLYVEKIITLLKGEENGN